VFVNYTPELGLDKFAPAGRKGEIRVTAYHQEPDRRAEALDQHRRRPTGTSAR